jgi:4-carboxymuconolactone decarboxylase
MPLASLAGLVEAAGILPIRRETVEMSAHRFVPRAATLLLASFAAVTAFAQSGGQLPADLDAASRARLPYRTKQDLGESGKRLADVFARNAQPTDPVRGPLAFALYNVPVATALLDLHDGAIKGTLNPHVRELAIMVASRETNYNLEWNGHEQAALKAGVSQKVLDVVRTGGPVTGLDEADAAVIRFGRELIDARRMSSETFAKAVQLFGKAGAMDLVAVMSTYAVSGFYAIAVDEQAQPGRPTLPRLK